MLPHTEELYRRSVRLRLRDSEVWLTTIEWTPGGEAVVSYPITDAGLADEERAERGETFDAIAGLDPRSDTPCFDASFDSVAWDRDAEVRIVREGAQSTVVFRRNGPEVTVWRAAATAVAPAVCADDDGAWVAFHHNLREDNGQTDLAKWIAVRRVEGERVLEPAGDMTDRDRDLAGEEQSFEFPSLARGVDGALTLFGRGSHRFYRQDLTAKGFGPRVGIDSGDWGCRGRGVAAVKRPDGQLVVAYRARKGVEIAVMPPAVGAPPLKEAVIEPPCVSVVLPKRRAPDPAATDGRMTLFGDIQQHSAHSDGIGSADEPYLRGRYTYGDDFAALTDHESFLGKRIGPGEWSYLQAVADRHDEPGEFVTIIAYEWTGKMHPGPGHKVVYLPTTGHDIVSRDDVPSGRDLVAKIVDQGAFTGPHHIGWTGADLEAHRPDAQPVWEICSCHGCYEHPEHPLGQRGDLRDQMVDAALRSGLRFGFIANSDSHGLLYHHGECRKRDPFRTGLTAVQATARTREAIFEAIRARRCYATSGAKILLDLRVGDMPMGSELPERGPHPAVATASGEHSLARLELVGPDGVVAVVERTAGTLELRAEASAPYVYARAVQENGEMAWSSPVFMGPKTDATA